MRTIAVLLVCALALQSAPKPEQIPWETSVEILYDRLVSVELTTGERLNGRWIGVTTTAFTMKIRHGLVSTPRAELSSIRASKHRIRGRVIGVLAGYGATGALAEAATHSREAAQGGWGIAILGAAVAGYFIGRSYDNALHEVNFVP